ncbi:MAG: hypothetical protein OXC80_10155 [Gammaproteobacteria bacterium]|nr:hypothetical protein [Gammaproteobacteria bacterium]
MDAKQRNSETRKSLFLAVRRRNVRDLLVDTQHLPVKYREDKNVIGMNLGDSTESNTSRLFIL